MPDPLGRIIAIPLSLSVGVGVVICFVQQAVAFPGLGCRPSCAIQSWRAVFSVASSSRSPSGRTMGRGVGKRTLRHEASRRYDHRRHPHFTGKRTHLPANVRFLERSQGAQRRLLCLGKPLDARDIEPLVGSIPPQRLQSSPLCRSQIMIAPSSPQLASLLPSGFTLSACTVP